MFYPHAPRIHESAPSGAREKALHIRRAARGESAVQRLASLDEAPARRGAAILAERNPIALLRQRARHSGDESRQAA